jgi:orotate phosphoribosyltransferase
MDNQLIQLFETQSGHFRLESGHHGDLWLEISLAFLRPSRMRPHARRLAEMLVAHRIEAICGALVEGAFLGQMVAEELDVEFCFAEQSPRPSTDGLFPIGYRVPAVLRPRIKGKRVAVVDDAINAGSAVRGAIEDLKACGAQLVAIGALLQLGDRAADLAHAETVPLVTLRRIESGTLWSPAVCPLCRAGIPLDDRRGMQ